jgi:hypothetical protein
MAEDIASGGSRTMGPSSFESLARRGGIGATPRQPSPMATSPSSGNPTVSSSAPVGAATADVPSPDGRPMTSAGPAIGPFPQGQRHSTFTGSDLSKQPGLSAAPPMTGTQPTPGGPAPMAYGGTPSPNRAAEMQKMGMGGGGQEKFIALLKALMSGIGGGGATPARPQESDVMKQWWGRGGRGF